MIRPILEQWTPLRTETKAMLCSVVDWKGSVPRKDYPFMLVLENGRTLGTIGGGSMEMKVTKTAVASFDTHKASIHDFDMTGSDVDADVGLCGGTMKILIEPFSPELESLYEDVANTFDTSSGTMLLVEFQRSTTLSVMRQLISSRDELPTIPELYSSFENKRSSWVEEDDQAFHLWFPFRLPTLHIFGAGHVGQAVAHLAAYNDIPVQVYDDRMELLTAERFPQAQLYPCKFPIIWDSLPFIPEDSFVLVASREHKHDRELLQGLLQQDRAYVGLVSSARKWQLLSEALLNDGVDQDRIDGVKAPVGLQIEAQTVPEIAVSILSEIIQVYRGRT